MENKNFLFVSLTGLISDIAWQVSKAGWARSCGPYFPAENSTGSSPP